MHKKLAVICFSVFLLIAFSSLANAQISTGTNSASSLKRQKAELKQQIKDAVAAKRLEVKAVAETKREEFKAKLQTIKNEKKKALVERIDAKLMHVNTKHTDKFTQVLNNLQILLDKISLTATRARVLADIATAQTAIDDAKTAVEAQAAKTYTITISTETALRSDVGAVTSQLRLDLMATHKAVVDAKQAVQALRKDNVIIKKEATSSANL